MLSHAPLSTHWSFGMSLLRWWGLFRPVTLVLLMRLIANLHRIQEGQRIFIWVSISRGMGGITWGYSKRGHY